MANQDGVLKGQRALITGASSGIGKAIAVAMAKAGASVVINFRAGGDKAREVVKEIEDAGGTAIALQADVSSEYEVQEMFAQMIKHFGSIDILVNNAGVQKDVPFHEMTLEQWNAAIAVDLTGQFICSREAVREFLKRGMVAELSCALGKIICISSVHDAIPWAGHVNYAAAKGGVKMFMKSIAQELAPQKIRVNAVSPGAIKTDINKSVWDTPEGMEGLLKLVPFGRIGEVEDVAKACVWLASDESDYITGDVLYVDGGMMLYPEFRTGG
ncbi:MAG: SDR family oxidoreductase [Thermodesulfobacteriota bacterium]